VRRLVGARSSRRAGVGAADVGRARHDPPRRADDRQRPRTAGGAGRPVGAHGRAAPVPGAAARAARAGSGRRPAGRAVAARVSEAAERAAAGRAEPRPKAVTTRTVNLSSPGRVLFPEDGITKGDVFEYYREAGPTLVPHLRGRPFTMKRYPHGIDGEVFFQKQAPRGMPAWIRTRRFTTHPREGGSRLVDFPLVNSVEAVLWMVQMNCVDMNAWYSRGDKPH